MNMYQPALNSYQHGLDQSLEGMFKLAAQPNPAQVFMGSLMQAEDRDYERERQAEQDRRAWEEQQRKAQHEKYLYDKLFTEDANKDRGLDIRETEATNRMTRHGENLDYKYEALGSQETLGWAQIRESAERRKAQALQHQAELLARNNRHKEAMRFRSAAQSASQKAAELSERRVKLAENKFAYLQAQGLSPNTAGQIYSRAFAQATDNGMSPEDAEAAADAMVDEAVKAAASVKAAPVTAAPASGAKTVAKKQYSASQNKTKIIYSDGTEQIVDGRQ